MWITKLSVKLKKGSFKFNFSTTNSNKERFLVKIDIEEAFNSIDYTFVNSVLKKFGFGNNFVS